MSFWRRTPVAVAEPERVDSSVPSLLSAIRDRVAERLRWVNELTEREVLAAGRSVNDIVGRATKHIAMLRDTLGRIGGDDHEVTRAIAEQSTTVREYAADMRARIVKHDEDTLRAVEEVAKTLQAAGVIATLTRQAKMLALNARIESTRAGERVRGFAVIADEMARLSNAVAQTNEQVQKLAGSLSELLPVMASDTRALRERAETFAGAATRQIEALDVHIAGLRADVAATVAASDETLAQVITDSHTALSHLQFQDVAAQRAMHIDSWLRDTQLEILGEVAPSDTQDDVAAPMHVEAGGGHVDDSVVNGDVLLF